MRELALFAVLLLALGIGFYLGRRQSRAQHASRQPTFDPVYVKGLNLLLNDDNDQAVDLFVEEFEVTPETLDTHLALGNQLRRKGEFAKATKIHQNLLARPNLTQAQRQEAQLELARDFMGAGLLDRAEGLLQDLTQPGGDYRSSALKLLIEIYQDEREWHKAITTAEHLAGRRFGRFHQPDSRRAHFCCELAQECLERQDLAGTRDCLNQALKFDRNSVRASLLLGELECRAGHWREALKALRQVAHQDPDYLPETLDLLCHCYRELGEQAELRALLHEWQGTQPSSRLVIKLAEQIRWTQDDFAAADYIAKELAKRPTMRLLNCLIDLQMLHLSGPARENLKTLKQLVDQVLALKPGYQCHNCGFTGGKLHWLCPRCKQWGSIKTIRGVEGD